MLWHPESRLSIYSICLISFYKYALHRTSTAIRCAVLVELLELVEILSYSECFSTLLVSLWALKRTSKLVCYTKNTLRPN